MKKYLLYIGAFLTLALCTTCTNNCYVPMLSRLGIFFMDDAHVNPLVIQHLTVQGIGSDSVLYKNASASEIFLPLRISAPVTEFAVRMGCPAKPDSLLDYVFTIHHESYPEFVSPECGCTQYFTLHDFSAIQVPDDPAVDDLYDTLRAEITNPHVVNVEKSIHIKIHF